jgi:ABC-2 type transport system ATP-binding protein
MAFLELSHVTKVYRKGFTARKVPAVVDLSFSLAEQGIVGFVGPNGAGKTTSIKMALGLLRPTGGAIRLMDREASEPASRRDTSFVSEQPYFYTHLTAVESLRFALSLRGDQTTGSVAGIREALETVGLADHGGKKVRDLSKGMQQRLNMAQALLGDPSFYIFDEPMSGLDPPGRSLFRRIFRELRDRGKTIFFSTHILEDIEALCSRVIVLSRGSLAYDGSVDALLARGFMGTELTAGALPAEVRAGLIAGGCTISDPAAGVVQIFVPAGQDVRAAQKRLAAAQVFCTSIVQRRLSLETLLYEKATAEDGA